MKVENLLNWLKKEKQKDQIEIEYTKARQISEIKNLTKKDLFDFQTKKMTIWERLRKTLMGY